MQIDNTTLYSLRFCARGVVSDAVLEDYALHSEYSHILEGLVLTVERRVWARQIDEQEIKYPATWWDAFKERWYPAWALLRWPAQHRCHSWKAYHTYPGLLIKGQSPTLHIQTYSHTD